MEDVVKERWIIKLTEIRHTKFWSVRCIQYTISSAMLACQTDTKHRKYFKAELRCSCVSPNEVHAWCHSLLRHCHLLHEHFPYLNVSAAFFYTQSWKSCVSRCTALPVSFARSGIYTKTSNHSNSTKQYYHCIYFTTISLVSFWRWTWNWRMFSIVLSSRKHISSEWN